MLSYLFLCFCNRQLLIPWQYPLSTLAKEEANDGREKGVGVIVSINKQRNDAWKLPEDILDKVELQVGDFCGVGAATAVINYDKL